jgi:hypothetical protein
MWGVPGGPGGSRGGAEVRRFLFRFRGHDLEVALVSGSGRGARGARPVTMGFWLMPDSTNYDGPAIAVWSDYI